MALKLARLEARRLAYNVCGEIEHVLGDCDILDLSKYSFWCAPCYGYRGGVPTKSFSSVATVTMYSQWSTPLWR